VKHRQPAKVQRHDKWATVAQIYCLVLHCIQQTYNQMKHNVCIKNNKQLVVHFLITHNYIFSDQAGFSVLQCLQFGLKYFVAPTFLK